ncbi:hypothetical protein [Holophaga foetida]|uniref:hypothetical protein n=1 Tax=Holophaga foetida TaxID=35839 RepID=UPI0002474681|nr:hypothetical protein [Holophaga foetida]
MSEAMLSEPEPMPVELEILLAQLGECDTLDYFPLHLDISHGAQDPDDMVLRSLMELQHVGLSPQDCIIHSTSWRFESTPRLVLTYLVYTDHPGFPRGQARRVDLRQLDLASNPDPARPRPTEIREEQVVAHGLRHLSFLIQTGQLKNSGRLLPGSLDTFQALTGVLAGRFTSSEIPSTTGVLL